MNNDRKLHPKLEDLMKAAKPVMLEGEEKRSKISEDHKGGKGKIKDSAER